MLLKQVLQVTIPKMAVVTLICLALAGCRTNSEAGILGNRNPEIRGPTQFSDRFQDLSQFDSQNIDIMYRVEALASKIVGFSQYFSDPDEFQAVTEEGDLVRWEISTKRIDYQEKLSSKLTAKGIGFDQTGGLMIIPEDVLEVNEKYLVGDPLIKNYRIRDLVNNINILCYGESCSNNNEQISIESAGFDISPSGEQYLTYIGDLIEIVWINEFKSIYGSSNIPDQDVFWHIGKAVFDKNGRYVIIAYEEKSLRVGGFDTNDTFFLPSFEISPEENVRAEVKNLVLDDSQTWLAVLYDDDLRLWDLRKSVTRPPKIFQFTDGNTVQFDRTGSILVIGTDTGLEFVDLESGNLFGQFQTKPEATALFFTQDNRFLIVGTSSGEIIVLGVPK